jgi:hypothetical protein
MQEVKDFTAADAKAIYDDVRSITGSYLREETNAVLREIEGCSRAGLNWLPIKGTISSVIKDRLVHAGFTVTETKADANYSASATISW